MGTLYVFYQETAYRNINKMEILCYSIFNFTVFAFNIIMHNYL